MSHHLFSSVGAVLRLLLWAMVTLCVIALCAVPTEPVVQVALGLLAIALIILLRSQAHSQGVRFLLLGAASIVVMRYWFWRVTTTIPGLEEPLSFAMALILFLVESYLIAVFFLGNFIMADPIDRTAPKPLRGAHLPSVDVLIPTYNEPPEMLAITIAAAKNMAYPEHLLNVVLCDDGGTTERCSELIPAKSSAARNRRRTLEALCEKLGATYITRHDNTGAKAGNLNHAMARLRGDLVAIFDSDHAPARDFLMRTVGYFADDAKLCLVQTPHFFLNDDPVARNMKLRRSDPAENEMFYNILHRGLDRWGGTFFCGSAAVLRRSALDEVGGISGDTITEDAETALKMHARGGNSLYVNHAMIAGLQAETFASFMQQRRRWATGMIQLFRLQNPLFKRGLTLTQRLCYLNSMIFWVFPLMRLVLLIAPLMYLIFGLQLFVATAAEASIYMITYVLVAFLTQNMLFGTSRRPLMSEVYETVQAPYLAGAVVRALLRPRRATFKVTSKDESVEETVLSQAYKPLFVLFALMLAGMAALVARWVALPGDRAILQIVGVWMVLNTALVGASLRALVEQQQRRIAPRIATNFEAAATLTDEAGQTQKFRAQIKDLSFSGAALVMHQEGASSAVPLPRPGDAIHFTPKQDGPEVAQITGTIRHLRSHGASLQVGVQFGAEQTAPAFRAIAAMLYGDSTRWQTIRSVRSAHVGFLVGVFRLVQMFFAGVFATLGILLTPRRTDEAPEAREEPTAWWTPEDATFAAASAQAVSALPDPPKDKKEPVQEVEYA